MYKSALIRLAETIRLLSMSPAAGENGDLLSVKLAKQSLRNQLCVEILKLEEFLLEQGSNAFKIVSETDCPEDMKLAEILNHVHTRFVLLAQKTAETKIFEEVDSVGEYRATESDVFDIITFLYPMTESGRISLVSYVCAKKTFEIKWNKSVLEAILNEEANLELGRSGKQLPSRQTPVEPSAKTGEKLLCGPTRIQHFDPLSAELVE